MALKKFEKKNTTFFPLILLTGFGKSLLFQALLQVRWTTHDVVSCKQHLEQDLSSIMAGNHYFHGQKTKSRSIGSDANYCNGWKLQMFGGETCHVHVKVDHTGHGNNRQE